MRKKYFGRYVYELGELVYKLTNADTGNDKTLRDGSRWSVGHVKFEFHVFKNDCGGKLMAVKNLNTSEEQILPDGKAILIATTPKAALGSFFKFERILKFEDRLTDVLKERNFQPQCMEVIKAESLGMQEIEMKSGYSETCLNFGPGKNNYKYFLLTDALNREVMSTTQPNCAMCMKKMAQKGKDVCTSPMKMRYVRLEGGTFYVTYRRNVATGEIQLSRVVITTEANRDEVAEKIAAL